MPVLPLDGMTSRRASPLNQRGAILVLTAVVSVILALLFVGIAELGRFMILREQAQTAADAAALAASLSGVEKMVKVRVYTDRGREEHCSTSCTTDEEGNESCTTDCWCSDCGVVTREVVGREVDLVDNGGWRRYCEPFCDCGGGKCEYEIVERWVRYDNYWPQRAAETFFEANRPWLAVLASVTRVNVHGDRRDPFYPSVTVYARAVMRSIAPGLFGAFPQTYTTDVCAQGDTFYRDPRTNRWVQAPPEACWKD